MSGRYKQKRMPLVVTCPITILDNPKSGMFCTSYVRSIQKRMPHIATITKIQSVDAVMLVVTCPMTVLGGPENGIFCTSYARSIQTKRMPHTATITKIQSINAMMLDL